MSLPVPPSIVSLPPAPDVARASFAFTPQLSPNTVSLPPSARIASLPSRPQIVSPAAEPVIVSLPLVAPKRVGIDASCGAGSITSGTPSPSLSVSAKLAVTERAALIDTWHVPMPEQPDPLQPVNVEPVSSCNARN